MTIRLHDNLSSGNGYEVRLLLAQLGVPYERIEYDIDRGETRTPQFLEGINANGRVPVLETERGEFLPESNAILCYLAQARPFYRRTRWRGRGISVDVFEQYGQVTTRKSYLSCRGGPPGGGRLVRGPAHAGVREGGRRDL